MKNFFAENIELILFFAFIIGISAIALQAYKVYLSDYPLEEYDMPHNDLSELSDFEEGFSDN